MTESKSVNGIMSHMEGCIRRELAERITAELQALAPKMIAEAAYKFNCALQVILTEGPLAPNEIVVRIRFEGPIEVEGNGRRS